MQPFWRARVPELSRKKSHQGSKELHRTNPCNIPMQHSTSPRRLFERYHIKVNAIVHSRGRFQCAKVTDYSVGELQLERNVRPHQKRTRSRSSVSLGVACMVVSRGLSVLNWHCLVRTTADRVSAINQSGPQDKQSNIFHGSTEICPSDIVRRARRRLANFKTRDCYIASSRRI